MFTIYLLSFADIYRVEDVSEHLMFFNREDDMGKKRPLEKKENVIHRECY